LSLVSFLRPLRGEFGAQPQHRVMNQHADMAHRERRDAADFFITESILEFQPDDLLLVRRQPADQT
jgi:hypothetical protein